MLCLVLASAAAAQEVKPVVSNDYLQLIQKDRQAATGRPLGDTIHNLAYSRLHLQNVYKNDQAITKIVVRHNVVSPKPAVDRSLLISGIYGASVEIRSVNRLPELQTRYVQGRGENGLPTWRGPEAGELFSYGPDINSLEYDGSIYTYDVNGRLVPKGTGNGKAAQAYNTDLFRNGKAASQSLNLQARYLRSSRQAITANMRLGRSQEDLFIRDNTNNGQNFSVSVSAPLRRYTLDASYNADWGQFTHTNRSGLLNRVYQNALLTPISFDNSQGTRIGAQQRSYSPSADNPFFLLQSPATPFLQGSRSGAFSVERRNGRLKTKLMQSLERVHQGGTEGYEAGTAFFPAGLSLNRDKTDVNYWLKASGTYDFPSGYPLESSVYANYIWSNDRSTINYDPGKHYQYRRSAQDASVGYRGTYSIWPNSRVLVKLGDKLHSSNTATNAAFFLPEAAVEITLYKPFGESHWSINMGSSFNRFNEELPVSTSFAQQSLTQYAVQDALAYFPVTEVNSFDHLAAIRHREASAFVEFSLYNHFSFKTEVIDRLTKDDIFPVYENGSLQLKNLADHRNRSIEFSLLYTHVKKDISIRSGLSFFAGRSKVLTVRDGYEGLPIAGFSNVYKALVTGGQVGAIIGSSFLRNAQGQQLIGNDGFPLVNNTPTVIGHPNPDFIVKTSHQLTWKKLSFNIDMEWSKGGEVWNGTQAMLDYYGRSKSSGDRRNTSNFVFAGVLEDGHPNNLPVRFYDPALPVEQNRWTRYGPGGVAEDYIQKADCIRLHQAGVSYKLIAKKYIQSVTFNFYVQNVLLWSASKGIDPGRLLYDAAGTEGLNFFNLPSTKTFGFHTSIQF